MSVIFSAASGEFNQLDTDNNKLDKRIKKIRISMSPIISRSYVSYSVEHRSEAGSVILGPCGTDIVYDRLMSLFKIPEAMEAISSDVQLLMTLLVSNYLDDSQKLGGFPSVMEQDFDVMVPVNGERGKQTKLLVKNIELCFEIDDEAGGYVCTTSTVEFSSNLGHHRYDCSLQDALVFAEKRMTKYNLGNDIYFSDDYKSIYLASNLIESQVIY